MIRILNLLSSKMNVTGAEKELSGFIFDYFKDLGFEPEYDLLGNLIVRENKKSRNSLMICCPLDNPGFLALYTEKSKSFLAPTDKSLENDKTIKELIDKSLSVYPCKTKKEFDPFKIIQKNEPILGEPFRLNTSLEVKDEKIIGKFASRYVLIYVLMKLADYIKEKDVALCFTTGFHSYSKSEKCLVNNLHPENLILLGSTDENEVVFLRKDGKVFSDAALKEQIFKISKFCKIPLKESVYSEPITKLESVIIPMQINKASLAIPCQNKGKTNESVQISKIENLIELLSNFINTI